MEIMLESLNCFKTCFVEKPLCLKENELNEIFRLSLEAKRGVMIGFNRRFSPFAKEIKKKFGEGRMTMLIE